MDVNVARQKVLEKIEGAEKLLKQCDGLSVCPGKSKLQRKIQAEIKFLRKLCKAPDSIKGEHLRCTNLAYLSSVVTCSLAVHGLVDVLKPFSCPEVILLLLVNYCTSHGTEMSAMSSTKAADSAPNLFFSLSFKLHTSKSKEQT
ncbi:hypothetical protein ISCGN_002750 [Ixodes scapularis]